MVQKPRRPVAQANIQGGKGNLYLRGTVKFYQMNRGVLVVAEVSGLPRSSGFFGFHIHEGESCTGIGFSDTGSYYDPTNMLHPMHVGDLPPLLSSSGRAYMAVLTDRFGVSEVIGRTVVIHSDPDDFHSQPAGNAGEKIACGIIRAVS